MEKKLKISIYIEFCMSILFLIVSFYSYNNIKKTVDEVKENTSYALFSTRSNKEGMNINAKDFDLNEEKVIATHEIEIDAKYYGMISDYEFRIIMYTFSDYQKSKGVIDSDGKEYTYQIFLNDKILTKEAEIPSYKVGDGLVLYNGKLKANKQDYKYKIVFKFYANKFDQTHLKTLNLDSAIKITKK